MSMNTLFVPLVDGLVVSVGEEFLVFYYDKPTKEGDTVASVFESMSGPTVRKEVIGWCFLMHKLRFLIRSCGSSAKRDNCVSRELHSPQVSVCVSCLFFFYISECLF